VGLPFYTLIVLAFFLAVKFTSICTTKAQRQEIEKQYFD
jgi:hypothetical protein